MMGASLRTRLLLSAAVFVGLALAAVWFILAGLFERQIAAEYEARLGAVADTLAANLVRKAGGWTIDREPVDPRYGVPGSGEYWQVTGDVAKPLRSRSLWDTTLAETGPLAARGSSLISLVGPVDEQLVAVSTRITVENSEPASFTLVAATHRDAYDAAVDGFASQLFTMLAATGIFLMLASALQVTVGLAPLTALSRRVADIRSGTARRLPEEGPQETGALVREVNQLLEARERDLDKARNRASDLAHGLKTPLTILAQIAERMEASRSALAKVSGTEIAEQVGAIRQRVDRQLALSRMSGLHGQKTDMRAATDKLVNVVRQLPTQGTVEWHNKIPPEVMAACEMNDFAEALGNVLDNARKFARTRIELTGGLRGAMAWLTVTDDGPGVPDGQVERIAERGMRLDTKESETGLGLAITREILEAHGGRLSLANAADGGLAVTLELPGAPAIGPGAAPLA
jgi:signal transduction histidine kinase